MVALFISCFAYAPTLLLGGRDEGMGGIDAWTGGGGGRGGGGGGMDERID